MLVWDIAPWAFRAGIFHRGKEVNETHARTVPKRLSCFRFGLVHLKVHEGSTDEKPSWPQRAADSGTQIPPRSPEEPRGARSLSSFSSFIAVTLVGTRMRSSQSPSFFSSFLCSWSTPLRCDVTEEGLGSGSILEGKGMKGWFWRT